MDPADKTSDFTQEALQFARTRLRAVNKEFTAWRNFFAYYSSVLNDDRCLSTFLTEQRILRTQASTNISL
jgi:hypothetical protein